MGTIRSMSFLFELFYLLGYTPWDLGDPLPAQRLRDVIEGPQALRPGRALDLGCGMGRYTIYLAQHGWKATGVDSVERALRDCSDLGSLRGELRLPGEALEQPLERHCEVQFCVRTRRPAYRSQPDQEGPFQ